MREHYAKPATLSQSGPDDAPYKGQCMQDIDPLEHKKATSRIARTIDHACAVPQSPALVARYFDANSRYAGATFDSLAPNPPNDIVEADLLALNTLTAPVEALAIRQLLNHGEPRGKVLEQLEAIPADTPLWKADATAIAAARELWQTLEAKVQGFGWVRVNKLIARKRPALIPVYDSVVRSWLGAPRPLWEPFGLAMDDPRRRKSITALAKGLDTAGASLLRVLDVAIWMLHSKSAATDRQQLGLPREPVPAPA